MVAFLAAMGLALVISLALLFVALAALATRTPVAMPVAAAQPLETSLEPILAGWTAALAYHQSAQRNLLALRLASLAAFLAAAAVIVAGWEVSTLDIDHLTWFLYLPFGFWVAAAFLDFLHYLPASLAARQALIAYADALAKWGGPLQAAARQAVGIVRPGRAAFAAFAFYLVPAAALAGLLFWFLPHSIGDEDDAGVHEAAVQVIYGSRTPR